MFEPRIGPFRVRVKDAAPMPVKPAGASDVDLHTGTVPQARNLGNL
jgi:hypothetical protein